MALYDRIGKGYDATRRADPELLARLRAHLAPRPDGRYLDLACGTGNYTRALADSGVNVCGLDASATMLTALRAKAPELELHQGQAEALPFENNTFDGVTCTLAIHHFDDRPLAFAEVHRVLKRGRFVLLTAGRDQTRGYWLNEYFPKALADSVEQLPPVDEVVETLRQVGFSKIRTDPYAVAEDLQDLFLYSGKHRPRLYFDARVRAGISTFASLADPAEVEAGLKRLEADLDSGRFERVKARYANDLGDYLFVVAEKG